MLGNFLKIDYIVVCFLKPLDSAWFLVGMEEEETLPSYQVNKLLILTVAGELFNEFEPD